MKCCLPLTLALLATTLGISEGQTLVDGANYPGLFGPAESVTVNPITSSPGLSALLKAVVDPNTSASGELGDYWTASATGGAEGYLLGIHTVSTGAQVALTGNGLEFNVDNDDDSLLGALGVGISLALEWEATAKFDAPGNLLLLAPNTIYQVEFDVIGNEGLFSSTLGLVPQFGFELLDGSGNAVGAVGGGSLVDILGLELLTIVGSPPDTRRAMAQFQTGSSVPGGAASIRFTGSALVPATALGIGEHYASVSDLSVTQVPEPSALVLGLLGVAVGFRRRR